MQFKNEFVKSGYPSTHPIMQELGAEVDLWSRAYDKTDITITESLSTPELDKELNRESPAHSEARALDIRTKDWSVQKVTACVTYFNEKYAKRLGYIRRSNNQRILMYVHGTGDNRHIHMAIGIDVIEKYKNSYPNWKYPVHTGKEVKAVTAPKARKPRSPNKPKEAVK